MNYLTYTGLAAGGAAMGHYLEDHSGVIFGVVASVVPLNILDSAREISSKLVTAANSLALGAGIFMGISAYHDYKVPAIYEARSQERYLATQDNRINPDISPLEEIVSLQTNQSQIKQEPTGL